MRDRIKSKGIRDAEAESQYEQERCFSAEDVEGKLQPNSLEECLEELQALRQQTRRSALLADWLTRGPRLN